MKMASFNPTVITNKGHALMAKIVAGTATPNFTKVSVSDYQYPGGTDYAALTAMTSIKQTSLVSAVSKINDASVKVSAALSNADLATGYYLRDIGLYAVDPQEGEILYSITTAITPDWIPPNNGVSASSILIDLITVVSNASNVSVDVDPNATATVSQIQALEADIANVKSFVGFNEADIYGVEVDFVNKTFKRLAGAVNKLPGTDFNGIKAFGGRKRCSLTDDGKVLAYYGEAGYVETGALTQQIIKDSVTYPVGTKVQCMVEQPKFYYKVVPLDIVPIPDYAEVNTLAVTAGASASGNLTITLDGVAFTVTVTAGDDATAVATKIRNAAYTGWTTGGSGTSVTFTCNTTGAKTTATFGAAATGVTATVTKTTAGGVSMGYHMRKARYYVSDYPKVGFKIHPAFVRNSVEKSKIYLPAYEGSIYDVSANAYLLADEQVADFTATTGDKLSSIAYAKPASGLTQDLTRAKTRILASNRGSGWQQKDALCASASQMLMMIEYAAMNMQTAIGLGVTNKTDDAATNMSELTGATTNLGNASGMAAGTNGLVAISYRGEENFWGNIWKWIDGLNIECSGLHYAWYADNTFSDNIKTAPYKNAGFTLAKVNGYISAIGWSETCDFLFLPTEVLGTSSLPVGDYFYQSHTYAGFLVALLGGVWYDGSAAGGFCWRLLNSSSARSRAFGGGAVYVPAA
jgi:hypothetical protein